MGTRGITQVIVDGKILVQQYGQWDHYATTAGEYLVGFLRKPENVEFLRNMGKLIVPTVSVEATNQIRLGEYVYGMRDDWSDVRDYVEDQRHSFMKEKHDWDEPEVMREIVRNTVNKMGFDRASTFLIASRDVGFKIVDLLKALHELRPEAALKTCVEYKTPYRNATGPLHGIFTISLNSKRSTFRVATYGGSLTRPLSNLPTDEELEKLED